VEQRGVVRGRRSGDRRIVEVVVHEERRKEVVPGSASGPAKAHASKCLRAVIALPRWIDCCTGRTCTMAGERHV
jgi:hypothetical protein